MNLTYLGYVYSTKMTKRITVLVPYHKVYKKYNKLMLYKKLYRVLDLRKEAIKGELVLIHKKNKNFILKKIYYTNL